MSTNFDTLNDHGASPSTSTTSPRRAVPQGNYREPSREHRNPQLRPMDPGLHRKDVPDTEFNRKYPPDPWGEEAAPNARVWKVYRDERSSYDKTMLDSWNKTLDVLLIFAGLFSAVSTAFLIESYKNLQPDYNQYIATVLYRALVLQNRSSDPVPQLRPVGPPDSFIQTTLTQRWTNGLWFSSLVVSLAVALLSILIKQWLDEYQLRTSRSGLSARDWGRRHCFYSEGLQDWGVPALISFLPVLLHLSLFLFFAGLVLFLVPLDKEIAYSLLAFIVALAALYLCSIFLPLAYLECPSATPLLAQIRRIWHIFLTFLAPGRDGSRNSRVKTFTSREEGVLESQKHHLDGSALAMLLHSTADDDIITVCVEAVGALHAPATLNALMASPNMLGSVIGYLASRLRFDDTEPPINHHSSVPYARALRAYLTLSSYRTFWNRLPYSPRVPDLSQSLGFDGLLLSLMDRTDGHSWFDLKSTLEALRTFSLPPRQDSSPESLVVGVPSRARQPVHRSVCLLFLSSTVDHLLKSSERAQNPSLPLALLVFCSGDFSRAEAHDLDIAFSSLVKLVTATKRLDDAGGEASPVARVFNLLCFILAACEDYLIEPHISEIIVNEAVRFGQLVHRDGARHTITRWDCRGMFAFISSAHFPRLVRSSSYLETFLRLASTASSMYNHDPALVWSCLAILLKTSSTTRFSDLSTFEAFLSRVGFGLSSGFPFYASLQPWLHTRVALMAFLDGEAAIGTWADIVVPEKTLDSYRLIAHGLACLVKQMPVLPQPEGREPIDLAERFFAGTFVVSCFHTRICHAHASGLSAAETWGQQWPALALHCLQLSAQRWLCVCDQLETTGEEDSEMQSFAVDCVRVLRDMFTRDGVPYPECSVPECGCHFRHATEAADQAQGEPGQVGRWRDARRMARFRPEEV